MIKPVKIPEGFARCEQHGLHSLAFNKGKCHRCETEAERKKNGQCCARLFHGPGHQSSTYCEVQGKHAVHRCTYGSFDQVATWTGLEDDQKFSGYFDEAPCVKED
jgi:hypothetical protein